MRNIFKNIIVPTLTFCFLLFIGLKTAHAASMLPPGWGDYIHDVIKPPKTGPGEEMAISFIKNLIRIVRYLVGGVALIMGILYGISLVFARGKEDTIAKQKMNFLWILLGFAILTISENVASIFNPEKAEISKLIDFDAARDQLRDIVNYVKWLMGSIIVFFMTVSSIRMITAQGDEEAISSQKRNLAWSVIGILIILLANSVVNAIYFINRPDEVTGGPAEKTISIVADVIRLILVFLGPIAIIFTIIAGIMYMTALDNDERMGKAKKMIVGGITAVVVIYASYALVNTLASSGLSEPQGKNIYQIEESSIA